ncbi:hypothetical protein [Vreelandella glaciei]|uniref:hypothetical protein n=1 Tax=Vreelandella glaciei TaxID=186761 RepID=UPI0030010799
MSAEQDLAEANVKISSLISEVTRFRDAAMGLNNIYPTITEGRQAVADGQYFSVPGDGAYMRLYRRQGTSAELIAEFPDRESLVSDIADAETTLSGLVADAVVAKEAAFVNADVYVDIAAGLAATPSGEQFQVVEVDDIARYRNDAGVATEVSRYPAVGNGFDRVVPSSKNRFNPGDVEYGYWYDNNGNISYNSARATTPKLPVGANTAITVSGLPEDWISSAFVLRFFNDLDEYVSGAGAGGASLTHHYATSIPSSAVTFVLTLEAQNIPAYLQIEFNDKPTDYEPHQGLSHGVAEAALPLKLKDKTSTKNLYDGKFFDFHQLIDGNLYNSSESSEIVSSPIPVEFGKYYTLSGLNPGFLGQRRDIVGFATDGLPIGAAGIKEFPDYSESTHTIYIDDSTVRFIVVQLSRGIGTPEGVAALTVQVEEGQEATAYDPYRPAIGTREAVTLSRRYTDDALAGFAPEKSAWLSALGRVSDFVEVGQPNVGYGYLLPTDFDKRPGALGLSYNLTAGETEDGAGNALFTQFTAGSDAVLDIYGHLFCTAPDGSSIEPRLAPRVFDVPSGQAENGSGPTPSYADTYPLANYTHPSVAYAATGIAGYTHWMIASFYPMIGGGGAIWEDEDLFVSNDGAQWLRVASLYETEKAHNAPGLRLPPTDASTTSRKYAFLPSYEEGDILEISSPEDNGNPAVDRQVVTLEGSPFKHDPAMVIHGGYVYTYHSFHLPYDGSGQGTHRFLACVRTQNGVDWEAVRSDGSTLPLDSEVAARQLFTKDAQGRYNYLYYAYSTNNSNPEIVKYGDNDFELIYGYNFSRKYAGTTPYNIDFSNPLPFQDVGSGNHPGVFYDGADLYLINNKGLYISGNRGGDFTQCPFSPLWAGLCHSQQYKKAACIAEGGKVLVFDIARYALPSTSILTDQFQGSNNAHLMVHYAYGSVAEMVDYAQNGLRDGYADLEVTRLSADGSERERIITPYAGIVGTYANVNNQVQKRHLGTVTVKAGDHVTATVTLTARTGGAVRFDSLSFVEQAL